MARSRRKAARWSKRASSILNKTLEGRNWIAGDFSVADAVVFYVEFWADKLDMTLPKNVLAHYRAMLARPMVSQVLREEGYRPDTLGQKGPK